MTSNILKNNIIINNSPKPLLGALGYETQKTSPFWLMRQAGRYLPEYRDIRSKAGGFMDLVFNPDMASEVTMQPIRRFGMDGAILFSDILVVLHALGQKLEFKHGEGPVLEPMRNENDLKNFKEAEFNNILSPIYETVAQVREKLTKEKFHNTTLIGFAGAPWTVACYAVEGGGSKDFMQVKNWAYRDPDGFQNLIDILVHATADYLIKQIEAGAEAIKIFDSWAGVLDEKGFKRWVIQPTKLVIAAVRSIYPDIPVIGFAKNAGLMITEYALETKIDAIAIDSSVPVSWASSNLQNLCAVQGNLDPAFLFAKEKELRQEIERILDSLGHQPFIFNLGHGIHKDTPIENVEILAQTIREWNR